MKSIRKGNGMKIFRAGKTRIGKDGISGWMTAEVPNISLDPWTKTVPLVLDVTTNEDSTRRTMIKVVFEEGDVEVLYETLVEGRKNKLRQKTDALVRAHQTIYELKKELGETKSTIESLKAPKLQLVKEA